MIFMWKELNCLVNLWFVFNVFSLGDYEPGCQKFNVIF